MIPAVSRALRLGALLAGVAVAFADSSIVVLALPDLLRKFDASITGVAWVITAYNLVLALASLALVPLVGRRDAARLACAGLALFVAASLACGAAWGLWPLVAFRSVQGLGGAMLLAGSLPLVRALARAPGRGTALWAGAGLFGAALGPAAGGLLTELLSWRAIFFAQAPLAALALAAASRVRPREPAAGDDGPAPRATRRLAANVALALASAALVGLLFLAVLLLIDVWRLSPLAAAAVVSAIPFATLAGQPLAARARSRSAAVAGVLLLAAGLVGLALLPARSVLWAVASLALSGFGLGLVAPSLSRIALSGGRPSAAAGAWTIWARHAGLVAGLLVLTPLLASDLSAGGRRAKLQATSAVLDAPLPATTKLELAFDLAPVLSHPPRRGLPDFEKELAPRHLPRATALGRRLDSIVQAAVTRSFRRSFLIAALLALLVALPFAVAVPGGQKRRLRAPAVALLVAAALIGAELARGALAYGARPRVLDPCEPRRALPGHGVDPAAQRVILGGLDALACRLHKSRELLVVDLAGAGVDAADLASRLESYAKRFSGSLAWLRKLLGP